MTYQEYVFKRNNAPLMTDDDFIQLLLDEAVNDDKINDSSDYFEYKKYLKFLNSHHSDMVHKHGRKNK